MLPFMSARGYRVLTGQTGSRVWWVRVLVTGFFLVWYNAVAVHLLMEPHPGFHGHSHPVPIGDCERGQMHSHEDDCHPPHLASDHGYLLTVRTLGPSVPDFILTDASSFGSPCPADGRLSGVLERPHRPGVDPPDPAQPRAPPAV
jgi:hypothetical protein